MSSNLSSISSSNGPPNNIPSLVRPHTSYLKNGNILAITSNGIEFHSPSSSQGSTTAASASILASSSSSFLSSSVTVTGSSSSSVPSSSHVITLKPEDFTYGDEIGRGASSRVIAGIHNPSRTPVALKLISVYDTAKKDQILREIAILYDSDCDCLIGFHGAFLLQEGYIALVLEYMDCGTLSNLLNMLALASVTSSSSSSSSYDSHSLLSSSGNSKQQQHHNTTMNLSSYSSLSSSTGSSTLPKRVPEAVAAAIGFQLLWACAYLKIEKRLHRDIKPSNILLNKYGYVKLSDFGLATALMNSLVGAYSVVGTCRYMAPERILRNDPALLSSILHRPLTDLPHQTSTTTNSSSSSHPPTTMNSSSSSSSTVMNDSIMMDNNDNGDNNNNLSYSYPADIWSVGLVIYEAATGTYPFGDSTGTYIEITESILQASEKITLPPEIQNEFSSYFLPFIQSCLMRDPLNRTTAEELLNSPWFQMFNITNVEDACSIMAEYLQSLFGISTETL